MAWATDWKWSLLLLAVSLVLFREVFLHRDQMLWGNDVARVFGVYTYNQHQAFSGRGELLLWDPTILGGLSAVGNPTQMVLSPLTWLFRLSASPLMYGLYFCLCATLGAYGTYLWLRAKSLPSVGAFLAATCFAYSGKTCGYVFAGQMDTLAAMMAAPWLFWAAEGILQHRTLSSAVRFGAVATVAATLSHLPTLYWNLFFVGVYVVLEWLRLGQHHGAPVVRRQILLFCAGGGIFLVGAAAWWLPVIRQTLVLSARDAHGGYEFASMFSAAPSDLARFLWPFFGHRLPTPFVSDPENNFFWETASYPGLIALCLAVFQIWSRFRRWDTWVLVGLALLALGLALGPHTPIHAIVYRLVPGVSMLRAPGRVLICANLFISCLAGLGVAQLLTVVGRPRWTLTAIAGGFLLVALTRAPGSNLATTNIVGTPLLSIVVFGLLALLATLHCRAWVSARILVLSLIALCLLDLGLVWRTHIVMADPGTVFGTNSVASFLEHQKEQHGPFRYFDPTETVPQQLAARHGLETITGYDSGLYRHQLMTYRSLWPAGEGSSVVQMFMHSPNDIACTNLLDALNVRYVVAYESELDSRYTKVFTTPDGEFSRPRSVYERVDPVPRAIVVPRGVAVTDEAGALQEICRIDPRTACTLQGASVDGCAAIQPVTIVSPRPGEVLASFQTEAAGVLYLSLSWHPDWVATDHGREIAVRRANFGFLGIPIASGDHDLRVWYRPWDFYLGCWLSGVFWIGIGATFLLTRAMRPGQDVRREAESVKAA